MNQEPEEPPPLSTSQIEKAVKLTYFQSVLGSVYLALTTGIFIIGFALKLGANNIQIGLVTSIPMFAVVM